MSTPASTACDEFSLLIQADLDGELDAAATAALAAHVADCPGCAELQRDLTSLSSRVRDELRPYAAPASLRRSLEARLLPAAPPAPSGFRRRLVPFASFGAGAAIAACLALLLLPASADPDAELVGDHIRALQPGHLTDVVSTEKQHGEATWFDGRIDYAPPVQDFSTSGFPLIGGRLDYIGGRPVAVLVYRRDKHLIDLYVWPDTGAPSPPVTEARNGYNIVRWTAGGMTFRAVSDVEARQLADFAGLLSP